jgi:hypothetical protein
MIASVAMRFTKDFEPPTYQTLVIESLDSLSESVQRFNGSTVASVLCPARAGAGHVPALRAGPLGLT